MIHNQIDAENMEDVDSAADDEFPEIMSYDERLQTFGEKGMWFEVGTASRQNMATWGFFCPDDDMRKKKAVRCVYCREEFSKWTRDDQPEVRHAQESPDCCFIKLNKKENELTIRQTIELELYTKLKIMVERKEKMKASVLATLDEVENMMSQK